MLNAKLGFELHEILDCYMKFGPGAIELRIKNCELQIVPISKSSNLQIFKSYFVDVS